MNKFVLTDSGFAKLAAEEIDYLFEAIVEKLPDIDADLISDVLYINTDNGSYVINQHSPTQQIWLSSPISNAGYFNYDPALKQWLDKNQQSIRHRLSEDLKIAL